MIIHLPESVALVSLSATVSNAEEFGEWLGTVRGETTTIVEERRPVPLYQHVMVGRRMYDLFADEGGDRPGRARAEHANTGQPELLRVARDDWASAGCATGVPPGGASGPTAARPDGRGVWMPQPRRGGRAARPRRPAARRSCSSSAGSAATPRSSSASNANLRLTTPEERDEIFAFVEERCSHIPDEDLQVLGYHEFLDGLTRGIAAHHAGMLPTFKECVEELFLRGLCRVVFATETLALGINMPARSVVIEKLSKWNGETHADITPGEYTQLTGRAGRRGIDVEGHGVVLWQPGLDPSAVAGLASTRTYPLKSCFRPSYNMAVNLVHQFGRERARELLESSFAQFQADKAVVGLARQLRKAEEALEGYAEAATCDRGDFMEYAGLRRQLSDTEKDLAKARRLDRRQEVIDSLESLRPGDVIEVPGGRFAGMAVVIDPGHASASRGADREGPRPYVLTADRHARRLSLVDFPTPVGLDHPGQGPAQLQRPRPAVAARPRLDPAQPDPQPDPTTAGQARAATAPRTPSDRRSTSCARSCARTRATLPRPRGPRPLGRALVQARPRRPHAAAPDRAAHQHHRAPVRPGLRRAHRARLPRGRGRRSG